ncbi:hypothetical protein HZS_6469, partial [Henneguya salminicola]
MTGTTKLDLYTSEKCGSDLTGDGSQTKPFASIKKAITLYEDKKSDLQIYVDSEASDETFRILSKTQLKKHMKELSLSQKKHESQLEHKKQEKREIRLDQASAVAVELDQNLPQPVQIKTREIPSNINRRVLVYGWVDSIRRQGKKLMFITIRDGSGYLQCVCADKLCQTNHALLLSPESTVCMYGVINTLPVGKIAPGGVELTCDYWELIALAPPGGLEAVLNEESNPDTQLNFRHLQLRTEETSNIMRVNSRALQAFRDHYTAMGYYEVNPPTLVQTQCEGGSSLFEFKYFEEIAEMPFISFEDLLESLEELVCDVLDRILASDVGEIVKKLNPSIKPFKRPIKRMLYSEAIQYLKDHDIRKDDNTFYELGDDIPEAPERKMTDQINEPIFLIKFPTHIKSFYMKRDPINAKLTESIDFLLPGVGEVIGGSMRMSNEQELLEAYKKEHIDPSPYYWYTDQRKFGTCEHGGYGLGFQRYVTWLLNRNHIRD